MNDPPGTMPRETAHPRRPPAHKSVSLRHSPPTTRSRPQHSFYQRRESKSQSSNNAPASDKANAPSSASPTPRITNKPSSGESSDAGKWFDNTNNAASRGDASYFDNDPPFFLRNSSSSETPPEGPDHRGAHLNVPAQSAMMPYRPGLPQFGTEGSSTEDFRSVIDDLTIANKRLKQKLRKYERLYDAHLQNDKLFEVRFHGLPDHKKRELEESLRKFAADLDHSPITEYPQVTYAPTLDHKPASSHTSRFAESGYASMSASGLNVSNAQSVQEDDRKKASKSAFHRQQQNVQAYLSDIPAGLMPRSAAPMTEKSKKKLVVRRLEQIFAGKRSVPGNHPMPMQQEEVAQSAAMADRRAKESTGQQYKREGLREARIMATDEDIVMPHAPPENLQKLRRGVGGNEQDFTGSGSPDQRPTRPLDLDPARAQIPEDNMEYIRHLGFTPPDMVSGAPPEDDHGWIYLNLLINMAQLHTINVTPDYVKEAVNEYSHKFELSHDGRKIRWKGGHELTRNSDSSSEHLSGGSPNDNPGGNSRSPTKLLKSGSSGSNGDAERRAKRLARAAKEKEQGKFAYTPLFFHKDDSEDEDDFYNLDVQSSDQSPYHAQTRGDSSGFASTALRSSSSRRRRDDGPIIFYNKAKFCTDLSGDRRGLSVADPATYKSITTEPIGAEPHPSTVTHTSERRGPLDASPVRSSDARDSERTTSSEDDLSFSPETLRSDVGNQNPDTMEFEASGLGGVQPEDHFAIKVQRSHVRSKGVAQVQPRSTSSRHKLYPRKILEALREQSSSDDDKSIIQEEILSAARRDLPSSTLPPASFLPFDSTSSGDVDSDLESTVSSSPSSGDSNDEGPQQNTFNEIRLLNISPNYNDSRESDAMDEEDDDEEDEESGSVDLLATARALDPSTVIASEREYDAALADRLAEEIPAGSSAATAGGGSGFVSPGSDMVVGDDNASMKRPSISDVASKNLKRSRTSESLAMGALPEKSQKRE